MNGTTPLLKPFRFCPQCGSERFVDNNVQSKRCLDCGLIYYINPKAAVVALITNEQGDILVCRRAKDPARGTLDLPGGFTDLDETAEEAVAREVREETSLIVTETRYLFSLPNLYAYGGLVVPHDGSLFRVSCSRYLRAFRPRRRSLRTLHAPPGNIARAVRSRIDTPGYNPHTGKKQIEKPLRNAEGNNNPEIRIRGEIPNERKGDTVHIPD